MPASPARTRCLRVICAAVHSLPIRPRHIERGSHEKVKDVPEGQAYNTTRGEASFLPLAVTALV